MSRTVRYRLQNKIARGGMAEIFLAWQVGAEGFQKQVVLKRILPALAADPSFVRMLVDEAHIASTLNHSNLVQVLDLGKSGEEFFLVLEFVDGWSLEHVRRRAHKAKIRLPLPLTLHIAASLCRALAYVHTRKRNGQPLGIVHRDVNPQNVLLSREGEVKLADFGIAKAIGKSEKSATGVIKGKFAYMSPEQSIGAELDARSDLFSVGTLLYILTTGKKPFEAATDLDLLMQVRKARFQKPSALVKDFNPDVERFIARALRADRTRRWQTAEQMADRIDGILLKLGQPSGSAVLKRWLENLGAKDGVLPPAEITEPTAVTGTIQLGSRDLELQNFSPPPDLREAEAEAPSPAWSSPPDQRLGTVSGTWESQRVTALAPAAGAPSVTSATSAMTAPAATAPTAPAATAQSAALAQMGATAPTVVLTEMTETAEFAESAGATAAGTNLAPAPAVRATAAPANSEPHEAPTSAAPPPDTVLRDEAVFSAPTRVTYPRRWLRSTAINLVMMLTVLVGAAYLAHPYLPAKVVDPVRAWLVKLPSAVRAGASLGAPPAPAPAPALAP